MELKDTVELMLSEDYRDRFIAEYCQTSIRFLKLTRMVDDWDSGTLDFEPKSDRADLDDQLQAMSDYIDVLYARAEQEGIDLPVIDV